MAYFVPETPLLARGELDVGARSCSAPRSSRYCPFSLLSPKISARHGPKVTLTLAAFTVSLGGVALPSLTAYRVLFAICAGSAALGAAVALVIPTHERR